MSACTDASPLGSCYTYFYILSISLLLFSWNSSSVIAPIARPKQGSGYMTRYQKHIHSFRKFGKVEMQRNKVNEDMINYLMGHKRDTYSEWADRYDELLEIYREARPTLDQRDALNDIVEYAQSRGYSLVPNTLTRLRDIRAGQDPHTDSCGKAEATEVFRNI
jgi:hypothetical protein